MQKRIQKEPTKDKEKVSKARALLHTIHFILIICVKDKKAELNSELGLSSLEVLACSTYLKK